MPLSPPPFEASLLPPSATPYMRSLEAAMRLPEDVWAALARVGAVIHDAPDEAVPFLIWEYGLEEVVPWVPDLRRVLREGRAWQKIRGTPASIAQALSWVSAPLTGFEEAPDDTWWDLFQLALARPVPDRRALAAIVALTRLSKPAHSDVIRVYTPAYDRRAVRINRATVNGPDLVGDWSGVWLRPFDQPGAWPKISFGDRIARRDSLWPDGFDFYGARQATIASRFDRDFGLRVNRDRVNGERVMEPRFSRAAQLEVRARSDLLIDWSAPFGDEPFDDGPFGVPIVWHGGRGMLRSTSGVLPLDLADTAKSALTATATVWASGFADAIGFGDGMFDEGRLMFDFVGRTTTETQ